MILKFIKRHRIVIIGGMWGLFSGVLYAWVIFAEGFAGNEFIFPESLKLIFLPAYLTDLISTALKNTLSLLVFTLWFAGIPVLLGIAIGASIEYLTNKLKKISSKKRKTH
ncbi:hypothetical protein KAI56_01055 [Candidatus Parcubacteria bacterium]|nr:hypothetical protein [Candidatus Parcubacteria bacterium]